MVLWTNLPNAVKHWPEGELLLTKYVSCTLMYKPKEYQKRSCQKLFVKHHGWYWAPIWLNSQIYGTLEKYSKCCKAVIRGLITTSQVCIFYFDVRTKRISEEDHAKIVCRTSHGILGAKLTKFPDIWYFQQIFKKLSSSDQRANYYWPTMYLVLWCMS